LNSKAESGQAFETVEGHIVNMVSHAGTRNSLMAKYSTILSAFKRGNYSAAFGALVAFKNFLNAQRGRKISETAYQAMLADVNKIEVNIQFLSGASEPPSALIKQKK